MGFFPTGACNETCSCVGPCSGDYSSLRAVTMPNLSRAAFTPWMLISFAALPLLSGCGAPKFYPVKGQVLLFGVGLLTEGEGMLLERLTPLYILKQAATNGVISRDDYNFLMNTMKYRDALAHGLKTSDFDPALVRDLVSATKRLLQSTTELGEEQ